MTLGGIGGVGKNPDEYAMKYAQESGISLDEAKTQLQEQYGDPVQDGAGSVWTLNLTASGGKLNESDVAYEVEAQVGSLGQDGISSIVQNIMNFFNGQNNDKQGEQQNSVMGAGPQKPGDPQPHMNQMSNPFGNTQQKEFTMSFEPQELDIQT